MRTTVSAHLRPGQRPPPEAAPRPLAAMPTPRRLPLVGTALARLAAGAAPHLHRYVHRRHRQLGAVFREALGPVDAVFVAEAGAMRAVFASEGRRPRHVLPEAWTAYNRMYGCGRGLFFMDGEEWAHHRKILNAVLLKGEMDWIETSCKAATANLLDSIEPNKEITDLESILYQWSLEVIVAVLVGKTAYNHLRPTLALNELSAKVKLIFETSSHLTIVPIGLASRLRIPAWRRFVRSVHEALAAAGALVDRLPAGDGLLARLHAAQVADADRRRIVVDLILAAGDTTAYAMLWLLHAVAPRAALQARLAAGGELARWTLREALRLRPVAPFLTRILPAAADVAGYRLPAGTPVVLSIYTSGRDPAVYSEPERFWPERWARGAEGYHAGMQQASLPFAMGLRSCVGRKIAEAQLQGALVELVRRFRVVGFNKGEVEMVLRMVAVPAEPIRLMFVPR